MLILASKSPRREEILRNAGYSFKIVPSDVEEIADAETPCTVAMEIARIKAKDVLKNYPDDTIIGADTIVVLDNEIMGKPKDRDDAYRMLSLLSGKTHHVITGVCVARKNCCNCFYEITAVEFYPLSDHEIREYILTGEPFDKAGGYGIQERGALLVKKINGDFFNVMGLPIALLSRNIVGED